MASSREAGAIAKKQLALRDHLWPGTDKRWLWDFHEDKGFTRIPKTLPLIAKIMDEMTKGAPISSTYLTLWCCTWDNNSFVTLNKPGEMANAAGFGGQRGVHTWASRMKMLYKLRRQAKVLKQWVGTVRAGGRRKAVKSMISKMVDVYR